jgi:hypothetical protein
MMNGQHQAAFQDPDAAKSGDTVAAGQNALSQMFGANAQAAQQIAGHAAQISGVNATVIQQMLPVLASMVMGGLMKAMQNQGLGGVLGQLGSLAQQGGFGSVFGQVFGQPGAGPAAPGAGSAPQSTPMPDMGAIFGNVLGGIFGGVRPSSEPPPDPAAQAQAAPSPSPAAGGLDPASVQAGLDTLSKMFNHGAQVSAAHQQAWADVLGQVFQQKKA